MADEIEKLQDVIYRVETLFEDLNSPGPKNAMVYVGCMMAIFSDYLKDRMDVLQAKQLANNFEKRGDLC